MLGSKWAGVVMSEDQVPVTDVQIDVCPKGGSLWPGRSLYI